MNLDKYLNAEYNLKTYNCGHFVARVWLDLTGKDITEICMSFMSGDMEHYAKLRKNMTKLRGPENPCIVVMQAVNATGHAGIYIDQGVLHLTELGVRHEQLGLIKAYWRTSYYK